MATIDETGRAQIVNNKDGEGITPSCVEYSKEEKKMIIGTEARKSLGKPNVFGRFKMEMGTAKKYIYGEKTFTPKELSSLVLTKLHQDAKHAIGSIEEAVITVPANFSNEAREDTMEAAKSAGLNVKYIINEPTAAALYYAMQENMTAGNYAVFDLGGGTFDVSIVSIDNMNTEVITSNGVSKLGGRDFDDLLVEHVKNKYKEETGKILDEDVYLLNDAESDKKTLSKKKSTFAGSIRDVDIQITRAEFEELISSYIAQMTMLCESTLLDAKLDKKICKECFL